MLRLRIGFVLIAIVLSFFGARLVQLQGVDPQAYALRAAAEGAARVTLVAERGDILDRNGVPLADSIKGKMVVADPALTADRPRAAPDRPRHPGRAPPPRTRRRERRRTRTGPSTRTRERAAP